MGSPLQKVAKYTLGSLVRLTLLPFRRGPHIVRYCMYRRIRAGLDGAPLRGSTLSISGSTPMVRALGIEGELVEAFYPAVDWLSLPYPDGRFDFVVSDQVLEHVAGNPQRAMDETRRVLKPGGLAFVATCLINPIHDAPGDFWRFTPWGLELLCRDYASVLQSGGWGNRWVWTIKDLGLRHAGVPEAAWHPYRWLALHDDPKWPVSTWVVARK